MIRPAAYCGIAGYKASFRLLPTVGLKAFSWSLDTVGLFAAGVADVAFLNGSLYAVLAGAGCSHGLAGTNNEILRINSDGSRTQVVNLSLFQKNHPVANPEPDDFEPDGTWYSMIAVRGALYAVEPNHGELDRITTSGEISRVADISASQCRPHIAKNGAPIVGATPTRPTQLILTSIPRDRP